MWIVSENLQRSAYVIFGVSLKPNLNSFYCYWDWGMNCVVLFDGNMLEKFVEILIYCIIWSISPVVLYVIMIKAEAWLRVFVTILAFRKYKQSFHPATFIWGICKVIFNAELGCSQTIHVFISSRWDYFNSVDRYCTGRFIIKNLPVLLGTKKNEQLWF